MTAKEAKQQKRPLNAVKWIVRYMMRCPLALLMS